MKYCDQCRKLFETDEEACPVCGNDLRDSGGSQKQDDDEIISIMPLIGLL